MNRTECHYFYNRDGLYLPSGSYTVEEITHQQLESLLKSQNKELPASQNYSYQSYINILK